MWTRRQFLETSSLAAALGLTARGALAQAPPAVTGTFTALRRQYRLFLRPAAAPSAG